MDRHIHPIHYLSSANDWDASFEAWEVALFGDLQRCCDGLLREGAAPRVCSTVNRGASRPPTTSGFLGVQITSPAIATPFCICGYFHPNYRHPGSNQDIPLVNTPSNLVGVLSIGHNNWSAPVQRFHPSTARLRNPHSSRTKVRLDLAVNCVQVFATI